MFSENLFLDENEEIWIDSDAPRVTKTGVDVKVSMNQEAVEAIFSQNRLYNIKKIKKAKCVLRMKTGKERKHD